MNRRNLFVAGGAGLRISTIDSCQRIGDLLSRVALRHDEFIIERKGKALAALEPVERLEQMRRFAPRHALEVMERQRPWPATARCLVPARIRTMTSTWRRPFEGRAAFVVTGDPDLLDPRRQEGIRIVSPRTFLDVLGQ